MGFDAEKLQGISLIYRYVYKNQGVHRNTLRNELLKNGKIASKAKFSSLLEGLVALGKIKLEKENVFLDTQIIQMGLLQKEGTNFFVVTPTSKKHIPVNKSVAAGYNPGDVLDIIIDYHGKDAEVVILGKSQKEFHSTEPKKKSMPEKVNQTTQTPTQIDNENSMLGRVVKLSHDDLVFIPNNKNFPLRQIPLLNSKEDLPKFQNRICVIQLTDMNAPILGGHITEVYGIAGNPMHEIEAIARYYNAIIDWDRPGLKEEIEKLPTTVNVDSLDLISEEDAQISQKGKTVDLRHIPIVTIDPQKCEDMDDAVYSTLDENGNIVLYSAIANITKYMPPEKSLLFEEYITHAFTLYTPNMAYGITPEKLSTGICCLTENEDRLALVAKIIIDSKTGEMKTFNIYDSVVRSRKKYAYNKTQQITDEYKESISFDYLKQKIASGEELSPVEQTIMNHYASEFIKMGFEKRRMIKFDSNKERTITLNDDMSKVEDIEAKISLPYEKVIEHFMLTTNESAAKYAIDNNLDTIFRIHEEPNPRKISKAGEFFGLLGIDMVDELSAQSTNAILDVVRGTASEEIVNNFLIRMQSRAIYSDKLYSDNKQVEDSPYASKPVSHYALQSPHYCHFTAGIRRSPDYVVHYNILAHIHGTKPMSKEQISKIIETANQRQIDIDHAEKDIADVVSVNWCQDHIGETFSGRIFKFRYTTSLDNTNSEILVIVKNPEKGFFVEIPLSQIIGNKSLDCSISEQGCAVYDNRGNVVLSILKPLDFIIESVDKVSLNIVGKTNRAMVNSAESRAEHGRSHYVAGRNGYANTKHNRVKRFESKKQHSNQPKRKRHEQKRGIPTHAKEYGEEE